MLKFSKTDRSLELDGVWLDFDDGLGNILKVNNKFIKCPKTKETIVRTSQNS